MYSLALVVTAYPRIYSKMQSAMLRNEFRPLVYYLMACLLTLSMLLCCHNLLHKPLGSAKLEVEDKRRALVRLEIVSQCSLSYESSSPSQSLPPSPCTPASKGDPSGSDSAEASLKKHYYFVAPVELSLDSSNLKIASPVDAEPSFHPEPISPCVDPIVHFTIVNLPHQRNTQHNTLPTFQCACGQPESSLSKVQLYESLDDAKALVDELAVYSSGAQNSGFAAFRLSPGDRAVSLVDTSSSFYSHHVDRSFDSIVHFAIGSLRYQWDIQKDTLLTPLSVKSIIAPKLSNDQWYVNNEETQTDVDSVMQDDSDLESSPTYFTNSNSSASLDVAGTPSTSNSPQQHGLLPGVGYFEPSPSRQKIDQWVDEAVAKHQTTRDGTYLKCPEPECTHTARRPHALKTHIYTHYGIKPYMCTMCGISVLTEANRVRHIKNAHTCSGCKLVGSISTIKSHKAVCLPAATSSGPTRPNHTNRSPFIAPYLKF